MDTLGGSNEVIPPPVTA